MCDEQAFEDMIEYTRRAETMSRRRFGALSVGAGFIAALPPVAGAVDVKEADVEIKTPDGVCDAYFVHPSKGKSPAVLIWPDIFGLRPAFRQMGKRLAESGYSVLVVNPFYRTKKAPVVAEGADFQDPATRQTLMSLAGSLNPETVVTDAKTFVAYLDKQASVDTKRKIATTGYCMGGSFTMRTAAALPDRVGAGAAFHGGNGLATDKPDSPHLLVPQMKAQFLFAIAENDDKQKPDVKDKLREAFAAAKLPAEIEVYAAMHGWCPPDGRVYNHDLAEKAWSRMLVLFKTALA